MPTYEPPNWLLVVLGGLLILGALSGAIEPPTPKLSMPLVPLLLAGVAAAAVAGRSDRREVRRGAILVVVGVWLLLASMRLWGATYANSWPLLMVGIGLVNTVFPSASDRGRLGGLMLMVWGGLFWIAVKGLWGFGWSNIWPLVLVVVGGEMVVTAIAAQRRRSRTTEEAADG